MSLAVGVGVGVGIGIDIGIYIAPGYSVLIGFLVDRITNGSVAPHPPRS